MPNSSGSPSGDAFANGPAFGADPLAPNPYQAAPAAAANSNPYAAPVSASPGGFGAPIAGSGDPVAIRNHYLKHEASLRSVAWLYFFSGGLMLLVGVIAFVVSVIGIAQGDAAGFAGLIVGLFYTGVGVGTLFVARGIRALKNWARITLTVFGFIGLLGIPIGTLISAYILYLCLSEKGKFVCSPQYHQVVAATPHIKYKTWIVLKIVAGILFTLVGLAVLFALLAPLFN